MKAKITKAFDYAIGGIRVVKVLEGSIADGEIAECAIKNKWGEPVEAPAAKSPAIYEAPKEEPKEEETPRDEAPASKSMHRAPRNKGR